MLRLSTIVCLAALSTPCLAQTALPNSIAAGEVNSHSAVLWTRASSNGWVHFRFAQNPQFSGGVHHRWAYAHESALPVKVLASGLQSGCTYYYDATDSNGATQSGTFRTAPGSNATPGLHFGVSGDVRGDVMPYGSVSNVPASQLDFFVHLGDSIYADVPSPALPGVNQAVTLAEFRAKHNEVYSAFGGTNFLGDLRRSTAILAMIDDHEVTNDFAGGAAPSSDPRFDQHGNFINETQLFRNGLKAFVEYNPLVPTWYGETHDDRTAFKRKLYRAQRYGRTAEVFMLDERSFRDLELPPANPADSASVGAFLAASFDPTRTMLGAKQLHDFKHDLLQAQNSGVIWKFVMMPEPIQNLGVLAASDRYEGYAAERSEILGYIVAHGIQNVVFVTADIHGTLVNDLSYQVGPGQPQIDTGAFEISTGPIAYDAPFGPTVVGLAYQLGLITQGQYAFYNSLPTAGKDAFVRSLVDGGLAPLGYNPIGLENSSIPATLLQGSYVATHVYGWSEFEIDAATHALTVTTWGVDPAQPLAAPAISSRFRVDAH